MGLISKTAINLSYEGADKITSLSNNEVLISINYPVRINNPHPLKVPKDDKVLVVFVPDTPIFLDINNPKAQEFMPDIDELKKIVDFCHKNWSRSFLVHCAAGVSRSVAVCLFLHLIWGHNLKDKFYDLTASNPYVLKELLNIHYSKNKFT